MNSKILKIPLLICGLVFLLFGLTCLKDHGEKKALAERLLGLEYRIAQIDAMENPSKKLLRYEKLEFVLPEARAKTLHVKFELALEILHQIQKARYNRILEEKVPELFEKFENELTAIVDGTSEMLSDPVGTGADLSWRLYNLRAAARLHLAYVVLETEQNEKKAAGLLRDAVADLSKSIDAVDTMPHNQLERNIPRWNLELLHGEEMIRKLALSPLDTERGMDLKENLETIIPEKGGYAPGDPISREVEK